jgi:hypothetical protein
MNIYAILVKWRSNDSLQILHTTEKKVYIKALEKYYIYKICEQGNKNHLNDVFPDKKSPIYDVIISLFDNNHPSIGKITLHSSPTAYHPK